MSQDSVLPQESDAQRIGHRADKCFRAQAPESWRISSLSGDDDVGFDYQVQLVHGGKFVGAFRAQLKGTESPHLNVSGDFYSISLERSTINYYARATEPILLVYCDLSGSAKTSECPAFYVWIHDELERFRDEGKDASDSASLAVRVSVENQLTEDTDIRHELEDNLRRRKVMDLLDGAVETALPSLGQDERTSLLESVAQNLPNYSGSLLQAIASPVATPWPNAPRGSNPGKLDEAGRMISIGAVDKAIMVLDDLAPYFASLLPIEQAEYWHCRGLVASRNIDERAASECYARACQCSGDGIRYLIAWAESELVIRCLEGTQHNLADLKSRLTSDAVEVRVMLARLVATEGDYEGAYRILNALPRNDAIRALAVFASMQGRYEEVVNLSSEGLSLHPHDARSRQLLYTLRARAKFMQAIHVPVAALGDQDIVIESATGPADMDVKLLQEAWSDIEESRILLRQSGWPNNTQFLVDIWCSTSIMLGRANEAFQELKEVAATRPTLELVQWALETLGMHVQDYSVALAANERQPDSPLRTFRRVGILYQGKRYRECLSLVEARLDNLPLDHKLYPISVALGALSAENLLFSERADALAYRLQSKPEWSGDFAVLQYFRAVERSTLSRDSAVRILIDEYERQGQPKSIAAQLFHVLDPCKSEEAETCIRVARRVREFQQLSVEGEMILAQAYTTLSQWGDLLTAMIEAASRFKHVGKFVALKALALDKLGQTPGALSELTRLLESGDTDRVTFEAYVSIVTRCGFTEDAIKLVERILADETDSERKLRSLKLLFSLLHATEPGSRRCVDVVWEIGRLVDQSDEQAEGHFLGSFLTATLHATTDVVFDERRDEFQKRMSAYAEHWPESKIIRQGRLPENPTVQDLERMLKSVLGDPAERHAWRVKIERQLGRGEIPVPYVWRPGRILVGVRDVAELWEVGKNSARDAQQYHLQMAINSYSPRSRRDTVSVVPILDLTALLVILDLNLWDVLFQVFSNIAISQTTLLEIQKQASHVIGSSARASYVRLSEELKRRFEHIQQPMAGETDEDVDSQEAPPSDDLRVIVQSGRHPIYSDDALFRIYATNADDGSPGFCTLDLLGIADEMEILSAEQIGEKIGLLCMWHVGVNIPSRYLIASLPETVAKAKGIGEAIDAIKASPTCEAMFEGIWNVRKPYGVMTGHVIALLSELASNVQNDLKVVSAILGIWYGKAKLRTDAAGTAVERLALVVAMSAGRTQPASEDVSRRFWNVYNGLVELHFGTQMDEEREREAIDAMGRLCAQIALSDVQGNPGQAAHSAMQLGLVKGTANYERFENAYGAALIALRSQNH